MSQIYVRKDIRQTHIVVGDSVVKIDDRVLTMNPDIIKEYIAIDNRIVHCLDSENKQLLQRLARKIVI